VAVEKECEWECEWECESVEGVFLNGGSDTVDTLDELSEMEEFDPSLDSDRIVDGVCCCPDNFSWG
jgi:hypothetical protein